MDYMHVDTSALVKTAREQKARLEEALRNCQAAIKADEATLGQGTAAILVSLDAKFADEELMCHFMHAQLVMGEKMEKSNQMFQSQP